MSPEGTDLAGRHVAVTGAGSGIGRAIALRLAGRGAKLSLYGRRDGPLRETTEEAGRRGAEAAVARAADVRDRPALELAFASAARELGPLHACVANAGLGGPNGPDHEGGADERFDDVVSVNLSGTYRTLRAAERLLEPGPDPRHLVATSSVLARIGVPGYTAYCASKASILGLVRALAHELAPENVQVNAICPGWVDTEMARAGIAGIAEALGTSYEQALEVAMREVPLRRMSAPEDVAGLVSWLVSPDARGVTGQALDMNNGAFMI